MTLETILCTFVAQYNYKKVQMIKEKFGKNIKLYRKLKGLTQEHLAEMISVNQRQLARIEAGESFVTAETLEKLCIKLEVSVKDIFNFDYPEKEAANYDEIKCLNLLLNDLKKISLSEKKLEFVMIAVKALENKSAMKELKTLIKGIELLQ